VNGTKKTEAAQQVQEQKGEQSSASLCSCFSPGDFAISLLVLVFFKTNDPSMQGMQFSTNTIAVIMSAKNFIVAKVMSYISII
jgi:hypothetical protein